MRPKERQTNGKLIRELLDKSQYESDNEFCAAPPAFSLTTLRRAIAGGPIRANTLTAIAAKLRPPVGVESLVTSSPGAIPSDGVSVPSKDPSGRVNDFVQAATTVISGALAAFGNADSQRVDWILAGIYVGIGEYLKRAGIKEDPQFDVTGTRSANSFYLDFQTSIASMMGVFDALFAGSLHTFGIYEIVCDNPDLFRNHVTQCFSDYALRTLPARGVDQRLRAFSQTHAFFIDLANGAAISVASPLTSDDIREAERISANQPLMPTAAHGPSLSEIVKSHELWLASDPKGKQAIFNGADLGDVQLIGADLSHALFEDANLTGADFNGAFLTGTSFRGAFLKGSVFTGAILNGANLSGAILRSTNFVAADLNDANLQASQAEEAIFRRASLTNANLSRANLDRADFREATLNSANLTEARLNSATMNHANLVGATILRADLTLAKMGSALLSGANLEGAVLRDAFLSASHLEQANLSYADLTGAVLSGADLKRAILKNAILADTKMSHATLVGADMQGTNLRRAVLNGVNLNRAVLTDADFRDSDLRDADLRDAQLTGTKFLGADLTGSLFNDGTRPDVSGKVSV